MSTYSFITDRDGPKLLVEYLRSIYPENLENF
jgi:hypothetical protein